MEVQTSGKNPITILVDESDLDLISKYKWYAIWRPKDRLRSIIANGYDEDGNKMIVFLHRLIMGLHKYDTRVVDHIDGNVANNQRSNLRVCTNKENCRNRKLSVNSTTGYKGVSFVKKDGKYAAYIRVDGKKISLGHYATAIEAYQAYCKAAKSYFGEYART